MGKLIVTCLKPLLNLYFNDLIFYMHVHMKIKITVDFDGIPLNDKKKLLIHTIWMDLKGIMLQGKVNTKGIYS